MHWVENGIQLKHHQLSHKSFCHDQVATQQPDEQQRLCKLAPAVAEQALAAHLCPRLAAVCLMHHLASLSAKQHAAESRHEQLLPEHIAAAGASPYKLQAFPALFFGLMLILVALEGPIVDMSAGSMQRICCRICRFVPT